MPHRAPARPQIRVARRLPVWVLTGLTVLGTLVSCGSDPESPSSSPSTSSQSSPASSAAASSSSKPTPASPSPSRRPSDEPSASRSAGPSAGGTLRSRLLPAAQLPGFNADYRWAQTTTGPEDPSASFGACQRFAMTSIGAERAVVRRYRPAGAGSAGSGDAGDRAGELVAAFPDDLTARRAFAVLEAWRANCADRLRTYRRSHVGGLQDVAVAGGRGRWYLLTYGPVPGDRTEQYFDAQGMAVVGSRIAMVSMRLAGQDYTYEPGREPMVGALRRAARRLS